MTKKFISLFGFLPKSKVKAGDGSDEGNFPFFTSSSILKKRISKAQYFDEAIIFGTGGSASIHYSDKPFSASTDCIIAKIKSKDINTKFVYYYLFVNIHLIERGFKGAGLKHISKKYIENLDIPIFPIETQNKIVTVLDKTISLINKRKKNLKIIDELITAKFLEMFRHLINSRSKSEILKNLIVPNDKINYGVVQPGDEVSDGIPIIRVGDFNDFCIDSSGLKKIDLKIHNKHKSSILQGEEVLIVCVGATIGKVALVDKSIKGLNIVRAIARINCSKKLKNTYLLNLLSTDFYQQKLKSLTRTVAQPTLNIKQIEELRIPIPPIDSQISFDKFYNKLIESKKKVKISLEELNYLFFSIYQKSFNDQLNFNIDLELDALINEIDLQKKDNDIKEISGDIAYLQKLIDKLNTQDFKEKEMYDKAKIVAFQLMNESKDKRKVTQEYDEKAKNIKLSLV